MQKINFQNLPNTTTPVNATNLNDLQDNVEDAISDIFESGNWTPTLANANVTYDQQYGLYFKIKNLVFVTWRLEGTIDSVSSPAYSFINGLPYNASLQQAGSLFNYANCFNDNTTPRLVRVVNNQIGIQDGSSGGTTISSWETGHGTFYLGGSATYLTDN